MNLFFILQLLVGIGLFLYGMSLLGSSLEKVAGVGLEKKLEKLTSSKPKGVLVGTAVTGIIQSSAATVIMVIGFLNAGIMKLVQAVPVIMGANIGTTVTAQILRLGDISSENIFLSLLKPSSFAPICIAVGAAILIISKKKKTKDIASIIIGLGILFVGMSTMESTLLPLKDSEEFRKLFFMFNNPVLGVLIGALATAILQSSSASVGVLQALSATGTITFSMAAPIIMGQNIGKCITVLIASIGTNKKAKRAVCIDVLVNLIGVVMFMTAIYSFQSIIGFSFWGNIVNRGDIANFHSLFNIITTLVLLPFSNLLIKLSGKLVRDSESTKIEKELKLLDNIFLKTPAVALEQCKKVILSMGEAVVENFSIACDLIDNYDKKKIMLLDENEKFLDRTETLLVDYLVKITESNLTSTDSLLITESIHTISDLERIGDYCVNLSEVCEFNSDQKINFSEECKEQLKYMTNAVKNILELTLKAYKDNNVHVAQEVEPLEETIDMIEELLKTTHVKRLRHGICTTQSGISFVELITNLERISDHCSNIAIHIVKRINKSDNFDIHRQLRDLHDGNCEEYSKLHEQYKNLYFYPLKALS